MSKNQTKKVKATKKEVEEFVGEDTIIKTREEMVADLGEEAVKDIEETAEEIEIVPEPVEEVEMFNGKKVIGKREVEINGIIRKEITIEDGSTYTI